MLAETKTPLLRLTLLDKEASIFDSKVGGLPYLPKDVEIPTDEDGKQMKLLAQINCRDLADLPGYPHEGLLQFWLTTKWPIEEHRVVYYQKVDEEVDQDEIALRIAAFVEGETGNSPVNGEYAMQFSLDEESISRDDKRFKALFCQYYTHLSEEYLEDPEEEDEIYDVYERYESDAYGGGHKVGGYKSRAQLPEYDDYYEGEEIDIRSEESEVLLFQLDSDCELDMQTREFKVDRVRWGDGGVGHFMIRRSDLETLNFSQVRFYWDCF